MPIDPLTVTIGTQLFNAGSQYLQNKRSENIANKNYEKQKRDNLEYFNMTNEYNSPQAQMKRFQEAGLNPNMIYGQMGNNSASQQRAPDIQRPEYTSPKIEAGPILGSIYDTQIKQAQIDNLKAQNTAIVENTALTRAKTRATMTDAERKIFDLDYAKQSSPHTLEAIKLGNQKIKVDTDFTTNQDARNAIATTNSSRELAQRLINMQREADQTIMQTQKGGQDIQESRNRIQMLKTDQALKEIETQIKRIELELNKKGIFRGDSSFERAMINQLGDTGTILGKATSLLPFIFKRR